MIYKYYLKNQKSFKKKLKKRREKTSGRYKNLSEEEKEKKASVSSGTK